jgi:hypothetical protein
MIYSSAAIVVELTTREAIPAESRTEKREKLGEFNSSTVKDLCYSVRVCSQLTDIRELQVQCGTGTPVLLHRRITGK